MKYSKNLLPINLVHNKDGKSTKEAVAAGAGANTKKHKSPCIKLHTVLHILRHHDSPVFWPGNREGSLCSIPAEIPPVLRELEGKKECFWEARKFPGSSQISQWSFLFPRESLKQGLNKNRAPLRGASLSQTHCIDFSTEHNCKWTASTSEKALQLAGLCETGGSAALSQQPSKQPVPRLWLQFWQRKIFTNVCGYISFFTPSAEGTLKPTLNKQHQLQGLWQMKSFGVWSDRETFKGMALLGLFSRNSAHCFATQDCSLHQAVGPFPAQILCHPRHSFPLLTPLFFKTLQQFNWKTNLSSWYTSEIFRSILKG